MKTINKLTLLSILASSTLLASDSSIVNSIGLNIGVSHSSYNQKNQIGDITLGNEPDKSFNSYELYTTLKPLSDICTKYNIKPYISYTYSSNIDIKHQYLLIGINQYHNANNSELNLYIGSLLGYGQIDYRYDPLNSSKSTNTDANSFIGGIQAGVTYPIAQKLSLNIGGKYLIHDYKTQLKPSDTVHTTIEHDSTSSVAIGLEYFF